MAGSIEDCLQALIRQTIPRANYEIIVVDDGSTDGTGRIAERCGATRVIRKPRGGYAAAARNLGIQAARGEITCFTDADCTPRPDWLAQITAPLANPQISGVKGVYTTKQRSLVARFVQLEYEEKYALLQHQQTVRFIDFYAAAFRRQVLLSNDGFDESFPNSEDRELSFRLATRGYRMVFQPHAVVDHIHAHTMPDYFHKKMRNGYWTAQVVRRFPTHSMDDSYTPRTQKIQILLIAAMLAGLGLMIFIRPAGLLALLAGIFFLFSTIGFVRQGWAKDWPAALVAPVLLAARATALGFGYAWGLLRPVRFDRKTPAIGGIAYLLKRGMDVFIALPVTLFMLILLPLVALANRGRVWEKTLLIGQHGAPFIRRAFLPVSFLPGRWRHIPAFWHVLKGEMSLVGPWPETADVVATYADWHRQRLAVKPGLVTPADSRLPLDERIRQELDYIHHYSLRRDEQLLRRAWR
jgi:cellulose synthase/poly-beta-1,6-N-acetylglucosamine synthase-like glycosyltransferase